MNAHIEVQPLSYKKRQRTFLLLIFIFITSLPFLYMYATGYRFDLRKPTNLISTGGMYIAVERTGAEIFIDNELVRETRTFRKAFYAQNLDAGTHRVHVQKEGYHTWVKELPVTRGLVTEAEALNLPLVPQVRVLSEWSTATGTVVVHTPLLVASTTQNIVATTTVATTTLIHNEEYTSLITKFASTTGIEESAKNKIRFPHITESASTTEEGTEATSTIVSSGVRLALSGDNNLYATWVGAFEQMPYYYCAPEFPRYGTTSISTFTIEADLVQNEEVLNSKLEEAPVSPGEIVTHPVQSIPENTACDPTIRIDRKWQTIHDFDFLPGTTDFVVVGLDDGIYVVEVDSRSWQNVQPLMMGNNLRFIIENGNIYVYDGSLIYQVLLQIE